MRFAWLGVGLLTVGAVLSARDASACGGCFVPDAVDSQVVGHRMVLSISQQQTTLWDQIKYSGQPESFAWVLPIKGKVDIELSSDILFAALSQFTDPQVYPTYPVCPPPPPDCYYGEVSAATGTSGGTGGASSGGVSVIAQEVVGPYETVQLAATDPQALESWLSGHGYAIPADVKPVVDAYVKEGFDFLALKLVPGAGIDSMRPVRVTAMGASPVLPLRMVAAGTGVTTPITLFVMGEGQYEPKNLPWFRIDPGALTWNWDTSSSNYDVMERGSFIASQNTAWNLVAGEPFDGASFTNLISQTTSFQPQNSGYGSAMDNYLTAQTEADQDLATLFVGINPSATTITRLHAELGRAALGADLQLGASKSQAPLNRSYEVPYAQQTGTPPQCQDWSQCQSGTTVTGGTSGIFGLFPNNGAGGGVPSSARSSCSIDRSSNQNELASLGLLGLVALAIRRRSRSTRVA